MSYITLTKDIVFSEHICCAFSDKKCSESYELKRKWLHSQFSRGYVFQRLDERAKVFIEYGPAENAWVPVTAPNYLMLGCFWVSGKYKGNGHGKALLQEAIVAAKKQKKEGLVTVAGTKKFHFMSDTKWLHRQGFETCETTPSGFSLLYLDFKNAGNQPCFNDSVKKGKCSPKTGLVAYYSNRCPYSEYHVQKSLVETAANRDIPLKTIKLDTMKKAQSAPTPATIFSLFHNGNFITTDLSVCMDSRFDKIMSKIKP